MGGNSLYATGEPCSTRELDLDDDVACDSDITLLRRRVLDLERRVQDLEALLTPEQAAQRDLIRKAEHVVDVAIAEGQLEFPPL